MNKTLIFLLLFSFNAFAAKNRSFCEGAANSFGSIFAMLASLKEKTYSISLKLPKELFQSKALRISLGKKPELEIKTFEFSLSHEIAVKLAMDHAGQVSELNTTNWQHIGKLREIQKTYKYYYSKLNQLMNILTEMKAESNNNNGDSAWNVQEQVLLQLFNNKDWQRLLALMSTCRMYKDIPSTPLSKDITSHPARNLGYYIDATNEITEYFARVLAKIGEFKSMRDPRLDAFIKDTKAKQRISKN